MKPYCFSSRFIFIFPFVMLNLSQHFQSFSQPAESDTNYIKTLVDSCNSLPDVQCGTGLLTLIQSNLTEAKNEKEKTFYRKAEITVLRNIGNTYKNSLSDLPKANEYYQMSRKKSEDAGDKLGMAASLLNIGIIYSDLADYPKALDYQEKSLKMFREIGDERGIGICLNNLGSIYKNQSNYKKALEYFQNSLVIQESRADTFEIMTCINNIGTVYENLRNFSKAMEYYEIGLSYAKRIDNTNGVIQSLTGIGNILLTKEKYNEAKQYYMEALHLADESGGLFIQSEVANSLRIIYEKQGHYKEALEMSDKHITLRDSIFSQNKSKEIALRDAKYESDKKEAEIRAEQEKEREHAAAESKQQKVIIFSVIGGLLLVIVFAGFIFRSLRVTRKQKSTIEAQKKLVEAHQKEIIDSITYAKRLQEAILPPLDFVKTHLPDSFILYKPKDIVAGDFYWMYAAPPPPEGGSSGVLSFEGQGGFQHPPSGGRGAVVFIAAADCTGHGVPGAMVSVVCSNALNRAVKEFGLRDTGKILDKVTELVLETFEKSGEDVKDGMDISLLAVQFPSPSERDGRVRLQWSGANNPLWYIQNGTLSEIKPDKQPIGKHDNRKPFITHTIVPPSEGRGAVFYLFTDGYADQFGGAKGKKFKYRQLEEKLLAMSDKPVTKQKDLLDKLFVDWKGELEQVDDVCIIGISV